jgi:hypothetical protein
MHYGSRIHGRVILEIEIVIVMTQAEWYSATCISRSESQAHPLRVQGRVVYHSTVVINNILHMWDTV